MLQPAFVNAHISPKSGEIWGTSVRAEKTSPKLFRLRRTASRQLQKQDGRLAPMSWRWLLPLLLSLPRARALGVPFDGTPGSLDAITDGNVLLK
jgi:hypothetical protein